MRNRAFWLLVTVFLFVFSLTTAVSAVGGPADRYGLDTTAGASGYQTAGEVSSVFGITKIVVNGALGALGIIFFAIMIYGGIRWMTARGNQEYAEKAKEAMMGAAIGIAIILAAFAIANFILGRLVVSDDGDLLLPDASCVQLIAASGGGECSNEAINGVYCADGRYDEPASDCAHCCLAEPPVSDTYAVCICADEVCVRNFNDTALACDVKCADLGREVQGVTGTVGSYGCEDYCTVNTCEGIW